MGSTHDFKHFNQVSVYYVFRSSLAKKKLITFYVFYSCKQWDPDMYTAPMT